MREKYTILALFWVCVGSCTNLANASDINNTKEDQDNNDWYLEFNSTAIVPPSQETYSNNISAANYDDSYNFSASIGYSKHQDEKFFKNIKIETEISFRNSDVAGNDIESKVSTFGLMANAFYDFRNTTNFQPYFGVGAGIANISIEGVENLSSKGDESHTLPAYQTIAGIAYNSEEFPSASIHVGYKYFTTIGKAVLQNIDHSHAESNSHNVEIGFKVSF